MNADDRLLAQIVFSLLGITFLLGTWLFGEMSDRRRLRVVSVIALIPFLITTPYIVGHFLGGARAMLDSSTACARWLDEAAAQIEAGEAPGVARESRALASEVDEHYEISRFVERMDESTARLQGLDH